MNHWLKKKNNWKEKLEKTISNFNYTTGSDFAVCLKSHIESSLPELKLEVDVRPQYIFFPIRIHVVACTPEFDIRHSDEEIYFNDILPKDFGLKEFRFIGI